MDLAPRDPPTELEQFSETYQGSLPDGCRRDWNKMCVCHNVGEA
jgi:hypothetical protein